MQRSYELSILLWHLNLPFCFDLDTISLFVKGHLNFKTICSSLNNNDVQFKHPTHICQVPFVFSQVPKSVFQFRVISRRKEQITHMMSPQNAPGTPMFPPPYFLQCFCTCLLEYRRHICPWVKNSIFNRKLHSLLSLFLLPMPEHTLIMLSFLQEAKMETAFSTARQNTAWQISSQVTASSSWRPCFRALQSVGPSITAGHLCFQNATFFLWDNKILPAAAAGEHRKHLKYLTSSAKDA